MLVKAKDFLIVSVLSSCRLYNAWWLITERKFDIINMNDTEAYDNGFESKQARIIK